MNFKFKIYYIISYYENYKGDNNPVDEFIYGVVIDEERNKLMERIWQIVRNVLLL